MYLKLYLRVIFILICVISTFISAEVSRARVYIDIESPELQPLPIAIDQFKDTGRSQPDLARRIMDILANDLTISGFFEIIPRSEFPQESNATADPPGYQSWLMSRSEALVIGGYSSKGERLAVEFRLFDLVEKVFLGGKRYEGSAKSLRNIIHHIANEITYHITGEKGVFDTKIAFVSTMSGNKEIYTVDFDGHNLRQITDNGSINLSPAWSPNGRLIAFTSYIKRNPDLYLFDLTRSVVTQLSTDPGLNAASAWSPDGSRMALMMRRDGNTEVFIINRDGTHPRRLTKSWSSEASPTWSPNGRKIAFVSDRAGSPQIYTMDINGRNVKRLTFLGTYNASPSWSPRGDRIAYCGRLNGRFDILTINPDGTGIRRLTENSGSNESPTWSPDGRFIAFSSTRGGQSRIYIMNANGANQRRLTSTKGKESSPTWSPRMDR
ncbi:MAG: Tol-Pal system beta propeller repeat protein TolB [Syntrophobacterales bacterium]|nr:MAG: Tol-Pal system beta propeller repeat protein TolB [Syntrophobacterales bacterium]